MAGRSNAALRRSTAGFPGSSRARLKGDFDVFSHNSTKCFVRLEVNKHTSCCCKAFIEEKESQIQQLTTRLLRVPGTDRRLRHQTPSETRHPVKRCAAPGQTPAPWQGLTLVQTRLNVWERRGTARNTVSRSEAPRRTNLITKKLSDAASVARPQSSSYTVWTNMTFWSNMC